MYSACQFLIDTLHGHDAGVEAQSVSLVDTLVGARYRAQLVGQINLAKAHHALRQRLVSKAGCDCEHHCQINRRFVQSHTADHVDVYIGRGKKQAAPFFQNRQQHHSAMVHTCGCAVMLRVWDRVICYSQIGSIAIVKCCTQ